MSGTYWLAELQERSFTRASTLTAGSYPPEHRMTGPELHAYLSDGQHVLLATTRPDGRPHAVPTGLVLHEHAVWLPVAAGAARLRHLATQPWASVVRMAGTGAEHRLVIVEGPAEVVAEPRPDVAAADPAGRNLSWASAWIRLRPRKVFSYTGTART